MALHVDLGPGDSIDIGNGTTVRVERKSGSRVKLAIDSDYRVTIVRKDAETRPARPTSSSDAVQGGLPRPRPEVD